MCSGQLLACDMWRGRQVKALLARVVLIIMFSLIRISQCTKNKHGRDGPLAQRGKPHAGQRAALAARHADLLTYHKFASYL